MLRKWAIPPIDMGSSARVAYSPGEFAELFGKSQTWGYRQIYAGKVNAITEHGRILIPASEVERILQSAGIYNGKPTKTVKKGRDKLPPEQESIWRRFVKMRTELPTHKLPTKGSAPSRVRPGMGVRDGASSRKEVLGKLRKSWSGSRGTK